jgi:hypothetical protein
MKRWGLRRGSMWRGGGWRDPKVEWVLKKEKGLKNYDIKYTMMFIELIPLYNLICNLLYRYRCKIAIQKER